MGEVQLEGSIMNHIAPNNEKSVRATRTCDHQLSPETVSRSNSNISTVERQAFLEYKYTAYTAHSKHEVMNSSLIII
jgi:hypothetical protein